MCSLFVYVLIVFARKDFSNTIEVRDVVFRTEKDCLAFKKTYIADMKLQYPNVEGKCTKEKLK